MSENLEEALSVEPTEAPKKVRGVGKILKAETPAEKRAKAIARSLSVNSDVPQLEGGPSPIAKSRGDDIANKFIVSAQQRKV